MTITVQKTFDLNEIFAFLPRIDALEEQMNNSSNIDSYSSSTSHGSSSNHFRLPFTEQEEEQNRKRVLDDWLKVLENKMPPYIRRIYQGKLTSDILEASDNIKLPYELRRWLQKYEILFNRSDSRYHLVRDFILDFFLDVRSFRVSASFDRFIARYPEHENKSTRTQFYEILRELKRFKLITKFILKEAENRSQRQCNFYSHLRATYEDLQIAIDDYIEDAKGFPPDPDPDPTPTTEQVIEQKANHRTIRKKAEQKSDVELIEDTEFQKVDFELKTAKNTIGKRRNINSNKASIKISKKQIEIQKIACKVITTYSTGHEEKCYETAYSFCKFCKRTMCGVHATKHVEELCGKRSPKATDFVLIDYNKVENSFLLTAGDNKNLLE